MLLFPYVCFLFCWCLQMEVAEAAANAVQKTYDTFWVRGTTCEVVCK